MDIGSGINGDIRVARVRRVSISISQRLTRLGETNELALSSVTTFSYVGLLIILSRAS